MAQPSLLLLPFLLAAASGNTPPIFNTTIEYVSEDLLIGEVAFVLKATDLDGDTLSYSISGADAFYFNVNQSTGVVTLRNLLDRESQARLTLTVTVSDGVNDATSRRLTVIVEDRNDNAPVFKGLPYETSVPENMMAGSIIYTISATDADTGNAAKVSYSILEVIPDNAKNFWLFYILPNGSVVLNGSLDYATNTFYQLKILAQDGGGPLYGVTVFQNSTTYFSITVIDLPNLNPRFLNEPYSGSVSENSPLGVSVLTVTATDRDTGVNDEIFYSITNASVPFAINTTTGIITVSGWLDREQLPSEEMLLEVLAREKNPDIHGSVANATTMVTIMVVDVNDNKPEFYQCSLPSCNFTKSQNNFTGSIIEHSSSKVPVSNLSIVARDPDKGINSTFELYLQGSSASAFSVSPTTIVGTGEVQILVQNPSEVDYEISHVMVVQLIANDTGNPANCCSVATVTVNLIDTNDHFPEFPQSVYVLSVMENSPAGTIIAPNITAYDPDSGAYGQITYQLLPDTILATFTVNATSGAVLVSPGALLDRETRSIYYANIQAKDGGDMMNTALLEIYVLDENDNAPIVTGSYFISVEEGQNVSMEVKAIDNDEPNTPNSELGFRILPGLFSDNFTINETTGQMHSKGPLDREALDDKDGQLVVTVEVYDHGVPPLSTQVNVTITVADINDNTPVFLEQSYEFSIFESSGRRCAGRLWDKGWHRVSARWALSVRLSADSFVGTVVATDADKTEINFRISFWLQSGSGSSNFLIRSHQLGTGNYSGQLSVDPDTTMDYDTLQQKSFYLTAVAENTATDIARNASVLVVVHVLDVNDEPPSIVPTSQTVTVKENGTQQGLVYTVSASDPDTNHSLVIEELQVTCLNDSKSVGDVCWDWFVLLPNGSLLVNSSEIDFEQCDTVKLTLRAEDLYTEKGDRYSKNGTLTINIEDINDNAPVFLPISETFVVVPEVSTVGLQVATVRATDVDSGLGGEITFSIFKVVFMEENGNNRTLENLFKVVTTVEQKIYMGSIQVASNLDSSLKGQYKVTVNAQDRTAPHNTAQTVLTIFTVDQSYCIRLQFSVPVEEVQSKLEDIKATLTIATKATVYVVAISNPDNSRAARAQVKSVMDAYFVYSNGTALDINQLSQLIQSDPQVLLKLVDMGLAIIGSGEVTETNKETQLIGIIAGLAAFLVLFILIMTLVLVLTTRSYKRKLNAMKALKVATTLSPTVAQQGAGIPGTNQYNAEGANPMLNLPMDLSHDLGFHEDTSSLASINSLDENKVDSPKDNNPKAKLHKSHPMDPTEDKVLVAALDAKEPTKMAYINNTFSTTDL
ncbi:cadherin-related family member 2 [Anas acuta]|uniref:cadherin-related family member 2 n=1 Tax=Anas acuta TaxID=28680 RepID=UPI0035C8A0B7